MQKDTNIKKMAEIEETIERKIAEEELNKKRAVKAVNKYQILEETSGLRRTRG